MIRNDERVRGARPEDRVHSLHRTRKTSPEFSDLPLSLDRAFPTDTEPRPPILPCRSGSPWLKSQKHGVHWVPLGPTHPHTRELVMNAHRLAKKTPSKFLLAAIFLFLSAELLQLGPSPAKAAGKAGSVEIESRSAKISDGEVVEYEVGTLFVPERRSDPGSRIIGVGFARFKCSVRPAPAPPVFQLPGGPGFSFLTRLEDADPSGLRQFMVHVKRLQVVGDVVFVDQRGFSPRGEILRSTFRFSPTPPGTPSSVEDDVTQFTSFARQVVSEYESREVDLAGYTVKECAGDVNDLRAALGYEKITLHATSFGSQWSFATMRLHPEIVARALLSGVEPLDHAYDMPSYVFAAIQRMWRFVESHRRFKRYLPPGGMCEAARVVIERLEREPLVIESKSRDGEPVKTVLGREDFPSRDPSQILELYHGHYQRWKRSEPSSPGPRQREMTLIGPLIDSSLGVTPERRHQLWTDPAVRYLGRDNFASYLATADIWPSEDVGDDFRRPILCNIPVVFAQGDWDLSTPIENTYEIAPFFPNSRVLIAEQGGHGVIEPIAQQKPEIWKTMEHFLITGDSSRIPARVKLQPSRGFTPPRFPLEK